MKYELPPGLHRVGAVNNIPVQLGGTLELTFADDVDVVTQVGRTLRIFDWTGVNPVGQFQVDSPYTWDLINLYTTGEVILLSLPIDPWDCNGDGLVDISDANCTPATKLDAFLMDNGFIQGDADGNGVVQFPDFVILADSFGNAGQYTDGDFDKNGLVQFGDFDLGRQLRSGRGRCHGPRTSLRRDLSARHALRTR